MGIISTIATAFENFKQAISNLSGGVKVFITLCILVGSLVFMIASYQMYITITYDPRFCLVACHPATDVMTESYYLWLESSHGQVTNCHDCHHSPMTGTIIEVYKTINRATEIKGAGHVEDEKCLECHEIEEVLEREFNPLLSPNVANVDVNKLPHMSESTLTGHGVHLVKEVPCVDCHGIKVHRFVPPKNICEKCHYDPELGPPEEFAEGEKGEH